MESSSEPASPGISGAAQITTWTGRETGRLPFPGRVVLPRATCEAWRSSNPQPFVSQDGNLFAVVDARNNRPQECDPEKDRGAGRYADASVTSPVKPGVEGERTERDGTVIRVLGWATGQYACIHDGTSGSDTWLKVWDGTGDQQRNSFMISATNVGFTNDTQLMQAGFPHTDTVFKGTRQGGC